MDAGVTMSGVLYSVGRTVVRIHEVVVFTVPLVFCAAVKVRVSPRTGIVTATYPFDLSE